MITSIDHPTKQTQISEAKDTAKAVLENRKPQAFLVGGAAVIAIGAGLLGAGESADAAATSNEKAPYSITYSNISEISANGTPIEAAEEAAAGMNEGKGPSDVQLRQLQVGAMASAEALRQDGIVVQEGDTVHVKVGELDGQPDENGDFGTDVDVTINTD